MKEGKTSSQPGFYFTQSLSSKGKGQNSISRKEESAKTQKSD